MVLPSTSPSPCASLMTLGSLGDALSDEQGSPLIARAEAFVLDLLRIVRSVAHGRSDHHKIFSNLHRLHEQLLVLAHVYSYLLQGGFVCTQRDVYYHLARYFRDQLAVNKVLEQVAIILQCSRHEMNVRAGCRGYVGGRVELDGMRLWELGQQGLAIDGRLASFFASDLPGTGTVEVLSGCSANIYAPKISFHGANIIIVVEKDAIFQRLMSERIYEYLPCVVVTGMGFPPLAVQALVRYLADAAALRASSAPIPIRVVGLVDYNPSGLHILLQYLNGSRRKGGSAFGVPSLKWLGLRSSDLARIDPSRVHPFTDRDSSMMKRLLSSRGTLPEEWRCEALAMANTRVKADIESLYTVRDGEAFGQFSKMIAQRIMHGDYI